MPTRTQLLALLTTRPLKKAGALSDPPGVLLLRTTIASDGHCTRPSIGPRLDASRGLLRCKPAKPHDAPSKSSLGAE
jgi:hypothetical protein